MGEWALEELEDAKVGEVYAGFFEEYYCGCYSGVEVVEGGAAIGREHEVKADVAVQVQVLHYFGADSEGFGDGVDGAFHGYAHVAVGVESSGDVEYFSVVGKEVDGVFGHLEAFHGYELGVAVEEFHYFSHLGC